MILFKNQKHRHKRSKHTKKKKRKQRPRKNGKEVNDFVQRFSYFFFFILSFLIHKITGKKNHIENKRAYSVTRKHIYTIIQKIIFIERTIFHYISIMYSIIVCVYV